MTWLFMFGATLTLTGAIAALSLRNLIHCALAAVVAFLGLALLFVDLGAPFVGLSQVLVNVGAVAILILIAILLTRGGETPDRWIFSGSRNIGIAVAALVGGSLVATILGSRRLPDPTAAVSDPGSAAAVRNIGERLMTEYVLPLELIGVLLTAALIGAVLIAKEERGAARRGQSSGVNGESPIAEDPPAPRVHS